MGRLILLAAVGLTWIAAARAQEPLGGIPIRPSYQARVIGAGPVQGAIICPDYQTAKWMFDLSMESWRSHAAATVTHGESVLIDGAPSGPPSLKAHGCSLAANGSILTVEEGHAVPVVSAMLPDGSMVSGVTLPWTIQRISQ